jgi:hypothetical protein
VRTSLAARDPPGTVNSLPTCIARAVIPLFGKLRRNSGKSTDDAASPARMSSAEPASKSRPVAWPSFGRTLRVGCGHGRFRKFLARIAAEVPDDLDVHLVCDNYSTHKHPTIVRWLAAHPRFHIHFIPSSAFSLRSRASSAHSDSPNDPLRSGFRLHGTRGRPEHRDGEVAHALTAHEVIAMSLSTIASPSLRVISRYSRPPCERIGGRCAAWLGERLSKKIHREFGEDTHKDDVESSSLSRPPCGFGTTGARQVVTLDPDTTCSFGRPGSSIVRLPLCRVN